MIPLGGAVVEDVARLVIFFLGVNPESSLFPRFRRRSLNGEEMTGADMCCVGGDGSWEGGGESIDCRVRHVENREDMAVMLDWLLEEWEWEVEGGEMGGEAKRVVDW